ncbi:uncharacterized protein [Ambystoma mexicanum]|uniref:uncharacterized protein isoform X2 n=1 Tax=Ambystoma mexicanum TaxID=8296 RepID=UPI0037E83AD1
MSAEILTNCRRMNTRSASRQGAEPPPATDSDTSSSVYSPCSQTSSSSSCSSKKETNEPDLSTSKDIGSTGKDAGSAVGDGGSALPNGDLAMADCSSATQDDVPNGSSVQNTKSSAHNGESIMHASRENAPAKLGSLPALRDRKTSLQEEPATHSIGSNPPPSSSPSTFPSRDSSSFCGGTYRKRKANFSNEETETLVKNVVKHFGALYGLEALRTESTRRNQRRSQLWNQIQRQVNDLGYTPRSIDDLKHKWRDIRLDVKRKVTTKRSIFNSRLTPMEKLVASTIGQSHLDGEHDGVYHEPGLPRQSIFYPLRGPAVLGESSRGDRTNSLNGFPSCRQSELPLGHPNFPYSNKVAPKPEPSKELSLVTPAILTTTSQTPAILTTTTHLTFITVPGATVTEGRALGKSKPESIDLKPSLEKLTTTEDEPAPSVSAGPPDGDSGPCDSQGSMASSPSGSLVQLTTQPELGSEGCSDKPTSIIASDQIEAFNFKMEEEEDDEPGKEGSQEMDIGSLPNEPVPPPWQDGQEEWEQQSGSPQRSENAREDSLHSSASQEGTQTPATDLPHRDGCSCLLEDRRTLWRTNMHRLLELEEQWDQLYHQELAMWEEERLQQREQRVQDRLLQQQLLGVLTDIRDELKQMREHRTASRENDATVNPPQAGNPQQTSSPAKSSPEKPETMHTNGDSSPASPKPAVSRGSAASTSSETWSPKATSSRRRPINTSSAPWSPKLVTPRSSGRPRGRPRKFPFEEFDG